jgi:hypothetical protein
MTILQNVVDLIFSHAMLDLIIQPYVKEEASYPRILGTMLNNLSSFSRKGGVVAFSLQYN